MSNLTLRIADLIRSNGAIDIARFMTLALAERSEGYYATRAPIGGRGDFVTSPEISQIFGELIGAFAAQSWLDFGRPERLTLAELGPGRATMMSDALRATKHVPGWHEALQLHLIETGQTLRGIQENIMAPYSPRFHENLADLPQDVPIVLLANEFLDCLPIRQFQLRNGGWHERLVGLDFAENLAFTLDRRALQLPLANKFEDGSIAEISPAREAIMHSVAEIVAASRGTALFIDYGCMDMDGANTFQAVAAHQKLDPLSNIGLQDLTSHVIFRPLADIAIKAGCQVFGPVPQHSFLAFLGARQRLQQLCAHANDAQRDLLVSGFERIMNPSDMGTLFKVMALTSGPGIPAGFQASERYSA